MAKSTRLRRIEEMGVMGYLGLGPWNGGVAKGARVQLGDSGTPLVSVPACPFTLDAGLRNQSGGPDVRH